jgi:hypothetical protein
MPGAADPAESATAEECPRNRDAGGAESPAFHWPSPTDRFFQPVYCSIEDPVWRVYRRLPATRGRSWRPPNPLESSHSNAPDPHSNASADRNSLRLRLPGVTARPPSTRSRVAPDRLEAGLSSDRRILIRRVAITTHCDSPAARSRISQDRDHVAMPLWQPEVDGGQRPSTRKCYRRYACCGYG